MVERYTTGGATNAAREAIDRSVRVDIAAFAEKGCVAVGSLAHHIQADIDLAFSHREGDEVQLPSTISIKIICSSLDQDHVASCSDSKVVIEQVALIEDILADRRSNLRDENFAGINQCEDAGQPTHHKALNYLCLKPPQTAMRRATRIRWCST